MVRDTATRLERAAGELEDLLVRAPHLFYFFVCVDQRDCWGDNQTSAKRNAELEKDPELREAEAVLAAANNGA